MKGFFLHKNCDLVYGWEHNRSDEGKVINKNESGEIKQAFSVIPQEYKWNIIWFPKTAWQQQRQHRFDVDFRLINFLSDSGYKVSLLYCTSKFQQLELIYLLTDVESQ